MRLDKSKILPRPKVLRVSPKGPLIRITLGTLTPKFRHQVLILAEMSWGVRETSEAMAVESLRRDWMAVALGQRGPAIPSLRFEETIS